MPILKLISNSERILRLIIKLSESSPKIDTDVLNSLCIFMLSWRNHIVGIIFLLELMAYVKNNFDYAIALNP